VLEPEPGLVLELGLELVGHSYQESRQLTAKSLMVPQKFSSSG